MRTASYSRIDVKELSQCQSAVLAFQETINVPLMPSKLIDVLNTVEKENSTFFFIIFLKKEKKRKRKRTRHSMRLEKAKKTLQKRNLSTSQKAEVSNSYFVAVSGSRIDRVSCKKLRFPLN